LALESDGTGGCGEGIGRSAGKEGGGGENVLYPSWKGF